MAVFLSVTTDAFEETRAKAKARERSYANVRRPLRGIQVKPNTYASIRVITAGGVPVPLFDSSSRDFDESTKIGTSDNYANFLIQSLQEQRAEKQQVIETFGEDYVYFFGERPRFLSVSGVLINTADFNWKSEFWTNYDQFLRGTKLVEKNARLYFYFDDIVVEGYLVAASSSADAQSPHMMPFQFQLYVTHYAILSNVGSVIFGASDTGVETKGIDPILPLAKERAARDKMAGTGGLTGFLAKSASFAQNADFTIQRTLENLRNTLYGRPLEVPRGLDSQAEGLVTPGKVKLSAPIDARGQYGQPPGALGDRVPIHEMTDEYVEREPVGLSTKLRLASELEATRIKGLLALKSPENLDAAARAAFELAGIDTGSHNAMLALLGRGAFAAIQYAAPYALKKLPGTRIGVVDQASQVVL